MAELTIKQAFAIIAGSFAVYVALLLTTGCGATDPDTDPGVGGMACYLSFGSVLSEWEVYAQEPVPEHCQHLDEDYEVRVVPSSEFPWGSCDPLAVGCTVPGRMTIYIEEGRSLRDTVATSVHEWIHALSECALGDLDPEHARSGLWLKYKPESVEFRALAGALAGECL